MTRDRLYDLLPAVYRIRDAEHGDRSRRCCRSSASRSTLVEERHRAALRQLVHRDLRGLGRAVHRRPGRLPTRADAGSRATSRTAQDARATAILMPRREVANTIRYRRRKGTLALLEAARHRRRRMAGAGRRVLHLLGWHQRRQPPAIGPARAHGRRAPRRAARICSAAPFDRLGAHRRRAAHQLAPQRAAATTSPASACSSGGSSPTRSPQTPAVLRRRASGPHASRSASSATTRRCSRATSRRPNRRTSPTSSTSRADPPRRSRRAPGSPATGRSRASSSGPASSEARTVSARAGAGRSDRRRRPDRLDVPAAPRHRRRRSGARAASRFRRSTPPKSGVWVSYHYGFSADIGGGEYDRAARSADRRRDVSRRARTRTLDTIGKALDRWRDRAATPTRSSRSTTAASTSSPSMSSSAPSRKACSCAPANGRRPVIRLLDWQTSQPDALTVTGRAAAASCSTAYGHRARRAGRRRAEGSVDDPPLARSCPAGGSTADCQPAAADRAQPRGLQPQRLS